MKILILINKYICKLIVKFDKRIIIFDDGYNLIAFCPRITILSDSLVDTIETVGLPTNYRYKNSDLKSICKKNDDLPTVHHNIYFEPINCELPPEYLSTFLRNHII